MSEFAPLSFDEIIARRKLIGDVCDASCRCGCAQDWRSFTDSLLAEVERLRALTEPPPLPMCTCGATSPWDPHANRCLLKLERDARAYRDAVGMDVR